jgi:hypothetical protein
MNTTVSYSNTSTRARDTRLGWVLRSLYAATPMAILLEALRTR